MDPIPTDPDTSTAAAVEAEIDAARAADALLRRQIEEPK